MTVKKSETEFGSMFRKIGAYVHKWRDRGFVNCPNCHTILTTCPKCKKSMLLPKAQTKPDFLVAFDYAYAEVKDGKDRWAFTESIRPIQRETMLEHDTAFLFLIMGTGRAPTGRSAYLIPWDKWLDIEEDLLDRNIKSIVYQQKGKVPSSEELFLEWKLEWTDGGWKLPKGKYQWILDKFTKA